MVCQWPGVRLPCLARNYLLSDPPHSNTSVILHSDVGKQVIINKIDGYLESRVAFCKPSRHQQPEQTTLYCYPVEYFH